MMDTDSYNLYYRKYGDSQEAYTKIPDIRENRYELKGLEDKTKYDVYLTGVNPLGEGPGIGPLYGSDGGPGSAGDAGL